MGRRNLEAKFPKPVCSIAWSFFLGRESFVRLERIAFNLIQIEGNPRPAQAGNIAVALNRVTTIERNTL
jgi:hypothetical protein